jgi:hypothetical protein
MQGFLSPISVSKIRRHDFHFGDTARSGENHDRHAPPFGVTPVRS